MIDRFFLLRPLPISKHFFLYLKVLVVVFKDLRKAILWRSKLYKFNMPPYRTTTWQNGGRTEMIERIKKILYNKVKSDLLATEKSLFHRQQKIAYKRISQSDS